MNIELNLNLSPVQQKGLALATDRYNAEAGLALSPEQYLATRVGDVLNSFADQARDEEARRVIAAFASARESDRVAVRVTLKLEEKR
jgi:hypothetical protein